MLPAFTYTPGDSSGGSYFQESGYQNELLFFVNGSTRVLGITPLTALTNGGGTDYINLNTFGNGSGSDECFNCSPYRLINGGFFTTAPEPGSLGLLGMAFASAGFFAPKLRSRVNQKR